MINPISKLTFDIQREKFMVNIKFDNRYITLANISSPPDCFLDSSKLNNKMLGENSD